MNAISSRMKIIVGAYQLAIYRKNAFTNINVLVVVVTYTGCSNYWNDFKNKNWMGEAQLCVF